MFILFKMVCPVHAKAFKKKRQLLKRPITKTILSKKQSRRRYPGWFNKYKTVVITVACTCVTADV